jgi:Domain of unknown function (DUF4345)
MRKSLQITLLILSLIPLFFGLTGVIFGTGRFLPVDAIVPQLDNQFRYLSGIYLLVSCLIWWMVPTIERHGTLLRIITLALFLGGVARAISWASVGQPPVFQIGAMFLEMSAPLFALWQSRVARQHPSNPSPAT